MMEPIALPGTIRMFQYLRPKHNQSLSKPELRTHNKHLDQKETIQNIFGQAIILIQLHFPRKALRL